MNPFSIGQRVELRFCPGPPGTVKALVRGRVAVLFDDFRDQPAKTFRAESLMALENVPKSTAFGTRPQTASAVKNSTTCREGGTQPFGTDRGIAARNRS
jgi:hypothetical protein